MEQKSKTYIRPIVIVMIFAFLTIGYAYLTSALNINGSTLLKKPTWDVHFENVQVKDGSVTGEQVTQEPTIGDNETSVTFHVNLKLPGDYYEFTVDAVNAGTIDAMIDTYTNLELTEEQQAYLETSVTYSDGEEIQQHQQLLVGDTAVYKIRVGYKLDLTAEDLPSAPSQLSFTFSTNFIQRDASLAIMRRAEHTLYNVLKNEAESGGLAKKYTGAHQDSIDSSRSTKDIYHWRASTRDDGARVSRMNNVLFGETCWRMIRTTDTGGVKLLYNGEANDGACARNRSSHKVFSGGGYNSLNRDYYYGTDYEYDKSSGKFTLSGNIFQRKWDDLNYESIIGNYTCLYTSTNSCSTLYYVYDYRDSTSGYCLSSTTDSFQIIGENVFNRSKTLSATGYMRDDTYDPLSLTFTDSARYEGKEYLMSSMNASTNYWYADSYEWDEATGKYSLVNPFKITSSSQYDSLAGKFTFLETDESYSQSTIYHIASMSSYTMYTYSLHSGKGINDYYLIIGDSIVENNGTYTINNVQNVSYYTFWNNIIDYQYKYTCGYNYSNSYCTVPRMISGYKYMDYYTYVSINNYLLVGKSRDNLTLLDTRLFRVDDFFAHYSSDYSDYKYTCGDTSSVCTPENLRFITQVYSYSYSYNKYYYFGHNVTWDGSKYNLTDIVEFENTGNNEVMSSHHFFCLDRSKSCASVGFRISGWEYIVLKDGITDLNDVINIALSSNVKDSCIKANVDRWFKKNLLDYSNYLEETIFCNNRILSNVGSVSLDGDLNGAKISFNTSNTLTSLSCFKESDRFSVSNNSAKLKYSVGLLTSSEIMLMGNYTYDIVMNWDSFWLSDSSRYSGGYSQRLGSNAYGMYIVELTKEDINNSRATRPVISIKPGMEIESGDGSYENPYTLRLD